MKRIKFTDLCHIAEYSKHLIPFEWSLSTSFKSTLFTFFCSNNKIMFMLSNGSLHVACDFSEHWTQTGKMGKSWVHFANWIICDSKSWK